MNNFHLPVLYSNFGLLLLLIVIYCPGIDLLSVLLPFYQFPAFYSPGTTRSSWINRTAFPTPSSARINSPIRPALSLMERSSKVDWIAEERFCAVSFPAGNGFWSQSSFCHQVSPNILVNDVRNNDLRNPCPEAGCGSTKPAMMNNRGTTRQQPSMRNGADPDDIFGQGCGCNGCFPSLNDHPAFGWLCRSRASIPPFGLASCLLKLMAPRLTTTGFSPESRNLTSTSGGSQFSGSGENQ